jgi:hypothetical protein
MMTKENFTGFWTDESDTLSFQAAGMEIPMRDWFAGMALSGLALELVPEELDLKTTCETAYKYADAMMKAREGNDG